ncbi:fimbrial protein [Salmonella enterica]|nr:fimbrial protein [Salmonella enterica]ECX8200054.1 fimbrial protein [Salmonella enterica]ELE6319727.1 fimbrial protein [Salmonella enterica]
MINNSIVIRKIAVISALCILIYKNAFALDIDIKIKGEIHIPPCIINNGNPIEIDFGDISPHKISFTGSDEFQKITKVSLKCDFNDGIPHLSVKGNKALNADVLSTTGINANKLGIAMYLGDSISNAGIVINSLDNSGYGQEISTGILQTNVKDTSFIFTSVPVKIGRSNLDAGPFTATATFSIHYF